ncbi:MAG: uracil-DNA glycosylase family protein [Actinomycetota bacterium]
MPDRVTVEVYEAEAGRWTAARRPQDGEHVAWVDAERRTGPVLDVGCGPGWSLGGLRPPRIALDVSSAMLELAAERAPDVARVRAAAERLPVRPGGLGGAVANRVLLHLPRTEVPLALAELQRAIAVDAPAFVRVLGQRSGRDLRAHGEFAGRLFSTWTPGEFERLCIGAGFEIESTDAPDDRDVERQAAASGDRPWELGLRLRRIRNLADTVGPDMRLLVCGLNPSPSAADAGVAFARPGNRFWPAAVAAGLVPESVDRRPVEALTDHGIGLTDLVKRVTRRADELGADEYRHGLDRVDRLVRWLQPAAVCFVGLAGWRAAVDRRAVPGPQVTSLGGRPVYLMPSTSGLNASSSLADLATHLAGAAELADGSS